VAPDIVKPVPLSVPELMVTGAVPVEVNVTGSVVGVFTTTLPNAALAGLIVNVGPAGVDPAVFSCRTKLLETLPALAVRVTACADVTEDTLAVNPALLAFAGTITVVGTVAVVVLLARLTLKPPLPAAAVSVTVQLSLPAPVNDALLQESALNDPTPAVPVLAGLFTAVPQPDSAKTRQHANRTHSSAHKLSSLRVEPRLHAQNELDTGVTSVKRACSSEADKKNYRWCKLQKFGPAAALNYPAAVNTTVITRKPTMTSQ
jgi:hypothetical protein